MFISHRSVKSKRAHFGWFTTATLLTLACSAVEPDSDWQSGASLREREATEPATMLEPSKAASGSLAPKAEPKDEVALERSEARAASSDEPSAAESADDMSRVQCSTMLQREPSDEAEAQAPITEHVFDRELFSLIWGSDERDVWALGELDAVSHADAQNAAFSCDPARFDANVVARHYDGSEWREVEFPGSTRINDLHGSAANNVWAVGAYANAWHYDGSTWTRYDLTSALGEELDSDACSEVVLRSVWVNNETDVWAVGYVRTKDALRGLLLHFDGERWEQKSAVGDEPLLSVWAADAEHVWVAGARGSVQSLNDDAWKREPTMTDRDLVSVCGGSEKNVWAADTDGTVLRYDGDNWQVNNTPDGPYTLTQSMTSRAGAGIWMVNGSVNDQYQYVQSVDHWDGEQWCSVRTTNDVSRMLTEVWVSPGGQVWAAGYGLVRLW